MVEESLHTQYLRPYLKKQKQKKSQSHRQMPSVHSGPGLRQWWRSDYYSLHSDSLELEHKGLLSSFIRKQS